MRKTVTLVLALLLSLCLTACAPAAEVTPIHTPFPTPVATPTPEPTPIPTPTPEPMPEPTPAPIRHEWSGWGYSYTSKALGIKMNFPPEWEKYITFKEVQQKDFLYYYTDEDGFGALAEEFTTVLYLMPKYESKNLPEGTWFARIFWEPAGTGDIASWESGVTVRLWESDAGIYTCWMDFMPQVGLDASEDIEDRLALAIYESVQNGIMDGRWEITVLEK